MNVIACRQIFDALTDVGYGWCWNFEFSLTEIGTESHLLPSNLVIEKTPKESRNQVILRK